MSPLPDKITIPLPQIDLTFLKWTPEDKFRVLIIGAVFAAVFSLFHFEILEHFELVTYDYRYQIKKARVTDDRIVVIEISDDSLARVGRWPWDRDWHAAMIQALTESGASAIVFDVIFSEPSSEPEKDSVLAQAISESGRVYLAKALENPKKENSPLFESLPEFMKGVKGAGHINLPPDADGKMRRIPLFVRHNGERIPQLALAAALDVMGVSLKDVEQKKHSVLIHHTKSGVLKTLEVPLDEHDNLILDWAGRWKETFHHFSFADVINAYAVSKNGEKSELDLHFFKDKICLIGAAATGVGDIRPNVLEALYPAVGVNLTVLNNLLEEKFIRKLSRMEETAILVLLCGILFVVLKLKSSFKAATLTALLGTGYFFAAEFLLVYANIWVNVVYALLLILLVYFSVTLYNQISIAIERVRLFKMATRDSLTGLVNIGHFKMLIKAELETLGKQPSRKLSIIMGDVDNFKKTNDTYGHVMGDIVLKEVAASVRANCRALDTPARYGGEEFILMLPGADAEEAAKIADKIRKAINQKVFTHEAGNFQTSISIGVTQIKPGEKDIETLVARADSGLYEAKQTGKNRVVIVSPDAKPPATHPEPDPH